MDKIILYKNDDGDIVQATNFELVDREELVAELEEARDSVRKLQAALTKYDSLVNADPGTDTETPTVLRSVEDDEGRIKFIKTPE